MTSHKEHIQLLIAEIDNVLQRTNPRLPWVMSGEVAQQRQVLERVRNFLVALQQTFPAQESLGQPLDGVNPMASALGITAGSTADMTPYQMMQAILQEVSYLRANLTPAVLNPTPPNQSQLTAELLQVLMSRLQENLSQQIAQTLDSIRHQSAYQAPPMLSGGMPPVPSPAQYEQLQTLRSRSDQMLVNLDSTLNVVFESLQRNIQAYQEALSQGLERMYSVGQQSEYTFKVLIDQLAQQLKQEASSLLSPASTNPPALSSPSSAPSVWDSESDQGSYQPEVARSQPPAPPVFPHLPQPTPPSPNAAFPYAGAELLSTEISGSAPTVPPPTFTDTNKRADASPETPLDSAIESWLQSVSTVNLDPDIPRTDPFSTELPPLDLSDLELGSIELPESPSIEGVEPISQDFSLSTPPHRLASMAPIATPGPDRVEEPVAEDDTADIDAVLKLLEELSAEVDSSTNTAVEDAEAQLEQMLSPTASSASETSVNDLPGDAQEELDEFLQDDFYQSLFGSEQEISPDEAPTDPPPPVSEAPAADTLDLSSITPPAEDLAASGLDHLTLDDDLLASFSAELELEITAEPTVASSQSITLDEDLLTSLGADLEPTIATEPTIKPAADPELSITLDDDLLASLSTDLEPAIATETPDEPPLFLELPADLFEPAIPAATPEISHNTIENEVLALTTPGFEPLATDQDSLIDLDTSAIAASGIDTFAAKESEDLGSLTDLFQGVPDAAARSVPVDPPVTRSSFPPAPPPSVQESETLFLGNDLFGQAAAPEINEDQFTRAAPDEILLPEGIQSQSSINLELDDFTLSSLSEDLSNLEGNLGSPEFSLPEVELTTAETSPSLQDSSLQDTPDSLQNTSENSLSLEDFAASLSSPAPVSSSPPPFYQASSEIANLSVEGFAELFDDTPVVQPPSVPTISIPPENPLPFSLEGTQDLFEEPSPAPMNPPTQAFINEPSPFTLEGMDDLFGDAPDVPAAALLPSQLQSPSPVPPQPVAESAADSREEPFTLEGMDDLFGNQPARSQPSPPPPVSPQPRSLPRREIPPFKPELYHPDDVVDAAPPFQLEQLDNLFAEPSTTNPAPVAPSNGTATTQVPDQQTLDAAFESLLGTPPASNAVNLQPQPGSQKKKTP